MKRILLSIGFLFWSFFVIYSQDCNCKHTIALNVTYIDAKNKNYLPGDTICLEAGTRRSLRLANFQGTQEKPIVFINKGGEVIIQGDDLRWGISIVNSKFFRLTGTGFSGSNYGIRILKTMAGGTMGVAVGDRSTNFEIDHLEIANVGFAGIMAKTDPVCDLSVNRGNFTQYQTLIHDNYIHKTGGEGLYIGHSFYLGYNKTCDGQTVVLYPSTLSGVRIYNNVIDSTGWDGMQVGSATEDCEIYNNKVSNYALSKISQQNVGIQLGCGTTGKCYNNTIIDGNGNGIAVFGNGNIDVYNNLIVNPGKDYVVEDISRPAHGIFVDSGSALAGSYNNIFNNTILNPKTDGIRFQNNISRVNNISNNIIVNPGSLLFYLKIPAKSPWINTNKPNVVFTASNNLFKTEIDSVYFVDPNNYNFRLKSNSPALDKGLDVSAFGINYDLDYNQRPSGGAFDIGAYESTSYNSAPQYSNSGIKNQKNQSSNTNKLVKQFEITDIANNTDFEIFPNPTNGKFRLKSNKTSDVNISIYDVMGKIIYRENNLKATDLEIDMANRLNNGRYFITINNGNNRSTKSLIVKK